MNTKSRAASKKQPGPYKEEHLKAAVILKVYMTVGESEQFARDFKHHQTGRKISKSDYAKQQIFRPAQSVKGHNKVSSPDPQERQSLLQFHLNKLEALGRQFAQINNNLNQSNKRLHEFKLWSQLGDEFKLQQPLIDELKLLTQQTHQLYTQLENNYEHFAE